MINPITAFQRWRDHRRKMKRFWQLFNEETEVLQEAWLVLVLLAEENQALQSSQQHTKKDAS